MNQNYKCCQQLFQREMFLMSGCLPFNVEIDAIANADIHFGI